MGRVGRDEEGGDLVSHDATRSTASGDGDGVGAGRFRSGQVCKGSGYKGKAHKLKTKRRRISHVRCAIDCDSKGIDSTVKAIYIVSGGHIYRKLVTQESWQ